MRLLYGSTILNASGDPTRDNRTVRGSREQCAGSLSTCVLVEGYASEYSPKTKNQTTERLLCKQAGRATLDNIFLYVLASVRATRSTPQPFFRFWRYIFFSSLRVTTFNLTTSEKYSRSLISLTNCVRSTLMALGDGRPRYGSTLLLWARWARMIFV